MNKVLSTIKIVLQVVMVTGFIIFEEFIWKIIAVPVKNWIAGLQVSKNVKAKIEVQTPYTILGIFLILFGIVEALGVYAGIVFVSGSFLLGLSLYALKIPVAGITFWIFSFSKTKLLAIDWFATLYNLTMRLFNFIKATRPYRIVKYRSYQVKKYIKAARATEGKFVQDLKMVYANIKNIFKAQEA